MLKFRDWTLRSVIILLILSIVNRLLWMSMVSFEMYFQFGVKKIVTGTQVKWIRGPRNNRFLYQKPINWGWCVAMQHPRVLIFLWVKRKTIFATINVTRMLEIPETIFISAIDGKWNVKIFISKQISNFLSILYMQKLKEIWLV